MAALMKTKSPSPKVPGGGPPLTVREKDLPALLGLSRATCRRLVESGRFPRPLRVGGCIMWRYADLSSWVAAGGKV